MPGFLLSAHSHSFVINAMGKIGQGADLSGLCILLSVDAARDAAQKRRHLSSLADDRHDHVVVHRIRKKPDSTNDDRRSVILAVYGDRAKRQSSCFHTENPENVRAITRKTLAGVR